MAFDAITRKPDRGLGEETLDQFLDVIPSDDIIRKGKTILEAKEGTRNDVILTCVTAIKTRTAVFH